MAYRRTQYYGVIFATFSRQSTGNQSCYASIFDGTLRIQEVVGSSLEPVENAILKVS